MIPIQFKNTTKLYKTRGKEDFAALSDVSFSIQEGEFFGLLGPNGAGKTTLISMLSGLISPTSGSVSVLGLNVQKNGTKVRRSIGIVPQEIAFDPFFTVREILTFQAGYYGIKQSSSWIDELLFRLALTEKENLSMRALSGGMKRRVMIAMALVHKPPVIVLDEPTAGVDIDLRYSLWQFISELNQKGHTILLTTHYLEEAEALCGRLAVMNKGKVLSLDKTSTLIESVSSSVLSFKTKDTLPADLLEKARVTGRVVQFTIDAPSQIEAYLSKARQANVALEDIEVRKADLSEVFSAIVANSNQGKLESMEMVKNEAGVV